MHKTCTTQQVLQQCTVVHALHSVLAEAVADTQLHPVGANFMYDFSCRDAHLTRNWVKSGVPTGRLVYSMGVYSRYKGPPDLGADALKVAILVG